MNNQNVELAVRIGLISDILLTTEFLNADNGKSFDDEGE